MTPQNTFITYKSFEYFMENSHEQKIGVILKSNSHESMLSILEKLCQWSEKSLMGYSTINGLTHSHTTKFGPNQIESICRRQIKCNKYDSFCL